MNVLEPKLVWVNGRCYRFFDSDAWNPEDTASMIDVQKTLTPEPSILKVMAAAERRPEPPRTESSNEKQKEKPSQPDIVIRPDSTGKYKHLLYVAPRYYPFIVGPKAVKLLNLERETKTGIFIPKPNTDCNCVIRGSSSSAVAHAIYRINHIIEKARQVIEPTHFLSVPMTNDIIKENFLKFRDAVANECASDEKIVRERIFVKPETLHLTLGTLLLVDPNEMEAMYKALAEWKSTILMPIIEKTGPIKIKIQGLNCTREELSWDRPIYANVSSENDALQQLAAQTAQFFVHKGLMNPHRNSVQLNMKLTNPIAPAQAKPHRETIQVPANHVLMAHKGHLVGETVLEVLHVSQPGKYGSDGYYTAQAKMGCLSP